MLALDFPYICLQFSWELVLGKLWANIVENLKQAQCAKTCNGKL